MTTLGDLGERKIVETIIPKFTDKVVGDDCAIVTAPAPTFAVTIDPVPSPAAKHLGGDDDLYWFGWLLVTISASDLAAAGATPVAFLAALELYKDLEVAEFERLLLGIKDSCHAQGLRYVGGNLKERIAPRDRAVDSREVHAVGTAIGTVAHGSAMTRQGAKAGDALVVVGHTGRFWADGLHCKGGGTVDKRKSPVFTPVSQLPHMHALAQSGLIHGSMDNSDGLLPSVGQLCQSSSVGAVVDLDLLRKEAQRYLHPGQSIDEPERLAFGWGDWNVVLAVPAGQVDALLKQAESLGTRGVRIGEFTSGSGVQLLRAGRKAMAPRIDSERFASDSWFVTGIQGYIDLMMKAQLP